MFTRVLLVATLALLLAAGCTPTDNKGRTNVVAADRRYTRTTNLQSKDITQMSAEMARDIVRAPVVQSSPYKLLCVMDRLEDQTRTRQVRNNIVLARIRTELNRNAMGRIQFVAKRADFERISRERGDADPFEDAIETTPERRKPNYMLHGVFYDHPQGRTNYHLCTFQLTDLRSGAIEWEGSYEVMLQR